MTDEATDRALERVLAELDEPRLLEEPVVAAESCVVERSFRETLGVLATAIEPMAIPERLRERLQRAISEEGTVVPIRDRADRPAERAGAGGWRVLPGLAAALAAATIGLAASSLWLAGELRRERIAAAELRRQGEASAKAAAQLGLARAELEAARRQMGLLTFGAEVCPLRPPAGGSVMPGAKGVLVIAADRTGWFLTAEGLEPQHPEQVFQLWFRRARTAEVVLGKSFTATAGRPLEVSAEEMPADADAAFVTLEDEAGVAQPLGPIVLYGDDAMRIL